MSGIVGKNLGRGSGLVKVGSVGADSVTGASIADDAIDSEHYTDASIDNAHLADNAVDTQEIADNSITLAKMAGGTDGNIISFDASGDPVAIATGSDGQVLTSTGAGSPPAFEAAGGFDVSTITGATALGAVPATTDELVLSDAGTLKRMDFNYIFNNPSFQAYGSATQTIANATVTKIAFNTENWDIGSCYDHSTNYRFTPNIAGKYFVYMAGQFGTASDWVGSNPVIILRNGTQVCSIQGDNEHYDTKYVAIVLDMNGSSDYVEGNARQDSGSDKTHACDDQSRVRFGAFRLVGV